MQGFGNRLRRSGAVFALLASVEVFAAAHAPAADPWLDRVRRFAPGDFAGFGANKLPRVVVGPPRGGGALQGATDVVSLGHGGRISVAFVDNVVVDGPGDDLAIFENAFHAGGEDGPVFTELGIVSLSADGLTWIEFPYDTGSGEGLAGRSPVFAHPGNEIDPLTAEGGGDRFDIGAVGLAFVRFVRIDDGGDTLPDAGNDVAPAGKGGFDLDAMAAIHSSAPAVVEGQVTDGGQPVELALVRLVPDDGTRPLRRRTHADGSFRFSTVLPSGGYRVIARRADLGRAETSIEVTVDSLEAEVALELE
jgi:hypothetical protein